MGFGSFLKSVLSGGVSDLFKKQSMGSGITEGLAEALGGHTFAAKVVPSMLDPVGAANKDIGDIWSTGGSFSDKFANTFDRLADPTNSVNYSLEHFGEQLPEGLRSKMPMLGGMVGGIAGGPGFAALGTGIGTHLAGGDSLDAQKAAGMAAIMAYLMQQAGDYTGGGGGEQAGQEAYGGATSMGDYVAPAEVGPTYADGTAMEAGTPMVVEGGGGEQTGQQIYGGATSAAETGTTTPQDVAWAQQVMRETSTPAGFSMQGSPTEYGRSGWTEAELAGSGWEPSGTTGSSFDFNTDDATKLARLLSEFLGGGDQSQGTPGQMSYFGGGTSPDMSELASQMAGRMRGDKGVMDESSMANVTQAMYTYPYAQEELKGYGKGQYYQ